jgi:hypothetical protein
VKTKRKLFLAVVLSVLLSLCQVGLVSGTEGECPPPPPPEGSITVHKFLDANRDGVQGEGEMDFEGWLIRLYAYVDGVLQVVAQGTTDGTGTVTFTGLTAEHTWYKVWEEVRECWEPTADLGRYDGGYFVLRKLYRPDQLNVTVEFGNRYTCAGTGTPGYWKNHPEAWPVDGITIGGVTYPKAEAIGLMDSPVKKDKTYTMFQALVAAKLNWFGNVSECIDGTIDAADLWMATYGPVGSGVGAGGSSSPWREGEPLYEALDAYNNGELCAPSRDALE